MEIEAHHGQSAAISARLGPFAKNIPVIPAAIANYVLVKRKMFRPKEMVYFVSILNQIRL